MLRFGINPVKFFILVEVFEKAIENVGAFQQLTLSRLNDIQFLFLVFRMDYVDDFLQKVFFLDVHLDDVASIILNHQ